MKLYYEQDRCQLYLGDARRLDAIKNKSIDMIIGDYE